MRIALSINCILFFLNSNAQVLHFTDSNNVQAKVWNKDKEKKVTYSDWKTYTSHSIEMIKGFNPIENDLRDNYGGNNFFTANATGYFKISKKGDRFLFSDPLGNAYFNIGINGIRTGKSENNTKAFNENFKSTDQWIEKTHLDISSFGFNSAGSWSDVNSITAYNKKAKPYFIYCTQLSLLSTFSQNKKTSSLNYPVLANIFNPSFAAWCNEKILENKDKFKDPNLLGHFSDNELPFQEKSITAFLKINDNNDPAFQAVIEWLKRNNIEKGKISEIDENKFSGFVAENYFKIVNDALKNLDPNHLYLGSRLHASAKNNPEVLRAAEKYLDVISINYYGSWDLNKKSNEQWASLSKPFMITEFYTKGEDANMENLSGAGWIVKTQKDRGIHYQNFILSFLQNKNCVGIHWFRYQDNDPTDKTADVSNKDSNKGMINTNYNWYKPLTDAMSSINNKIYQIIQFIDSQKK
jgi:hypothetical protein